MRAIPGAYDSRPPLDKVLPAPGGSFQARPTAARCIGYTFQLRMERTVVIGDIHGCPDELKQLVEKVGWQPGERLVFVGDLVAKGPDSQAVIAFARETGALAVLGNHD